MPDPAQTKELNAAAVNCGRGLLAHVFDPAGKVSVVGGMNNQLTQLPVDWEKAAPPLHVAGHKTWVAALGVHPAGNQLFSGDYSGLLLGWTFPLADGAATPAWSRQAHQGWIRALALSPDGALVATCGNDLVVRLWSTKDGSPQGEFAGHETHVYAVKFHPSGQQLVSGDLTGVIKHWDLAKKTFVRNLDGKRFFVQQANLRLGGTRSLTFDPKGERLLVGGMSGFGSIGDGIGGATASLFDWNSGLETHLMYSKDALRSFVNGVAFHPDGFLIGASGGLDQGSLLYWKPESPPAPPAVAAATPPPAADAKPAEPPKPPEPLKLDSFFNFKMPQSGWAMSMHPDGTHLAVAHHDNSLRYYTL